jgi:hypothetical protein
MKQNPLFPNEDPRHIRERELAKLRVLRDELRERAKANEHKRKVLEHTRKQEDWDEWKSYCTRLK